MGRTVPAFEDRVRQSGDQAIREASEFFMGRGSLNQALRDLIRHLDEAQIPYALLGALAMARHGLTRMTLDIDILVTPEGLAQFKARYLGRGYVAAFPGAEKTFRAANTGVRIEVITSGEYPSGNIPKSVSFPDPANAAVDSEGIRVIALERLIELKLASGMTAEHRLRDLADVQDLIRTLRLAPDFAGSLDSTVRSLYNQLWQKAQAPDRVQEERETGSL